MPLDEEPEAKGLEHLFCQVTPWNAQQETATIVEEMPQAKPNQEQEQLYIYIIYIDIFTIIMVTSNFGTCKVSGQHNCNNQRGRLQLLNYAGTAK